MIKYYFLRCEHKGICVYESATHAAEIIHEFGIGQYALDPQSIIDLNELDETTQFDYWQEAGKAEIGAKALVSTIGDLDDFINFNKKMLGTITYEENLREIYTSNITHYDCVINHIINKLSQEDVNSLLD